MFFLNRWEWCKNTTKKRFLFELRKKEDRMRVLVNFRSIASLKCCYQLSSRFLSKTQANQWWIKSMIFHYLLCERLNNILVKLTLIGRQSIDCCYVYATIDCCYVYVMCHVTNIQHHFVREKIIEKQIQLKRVFTTKQIINNFIKSFFRNSFEKFRKTLNFIWSLV